MCLVAERCWEPVGWACREHAWRFARLGAILEA
jgi:hypothetical protein